MLKFSKPRRHQHLSSNLTPFSLRLYKILVACLRAQSCLTLWLHEFLCPWGSPDQNIGVVAMPFFQGIFPVQGSNLHLLHCRHILYPLNHWRSPNYWLCYSIEELKRRCEKFLPMHPSYKQLQISPDISDTTIFNPGFEALKIPLSQTTCLSNKRNKTVIKLAAKLLFLGKRK